MKCKSVNFSKPVIIPITITYHYPIFLSVGNLITNRNNTPNLLTLTKINNSKLSNSSQSWKSVLEN